MPRANTKIGDVFSVKLEDNCKKYFQLIAFDLTQLNSDVIRAFKTVYPINTTPDLSEVVIGEVEFYAHCVTKWGIKLGYWEKVGNIVDVGRCDVLFRDTNDYGSKLGIEPIKISSNWYVWKINEKFEHIGKLEGIYKDSFIGIIINPQGIIELLKGNKYPVNYPD
jgi:hypothetical protein